MYEGKGYLNLKLVNGGQQGRCAAPRQQTFHRLTSGFPRPNLFPSCGRKVLEGHAMRYVPEREVRYDRCPFVSSLVTNQENGWTGRAE